MQDLSGGRIERYVSSSGDVNNDSSELHLYACTYTRTEVRTRMHTSIITSQGVDWLVEQCAALIGWSHLVCFIVLGAEMKFGHGDGKVRQWLSEIVVYWAYFRFLRFLKFSSKFRLDKAAYK